MCYTPRRQAFCWYTECCWACLSVNSRIFFMAPRAILQIPKIDSPSQHDVRDILHRTTAIRGNYRTFDSHGLCPTNWNIFMVHLLVCNGESINYICDVGLCRSACSLVEFICMHAVLSRVRFQKDLKWKLLDLYNLAKRHQRSNYLFLFPFFRTIADVHNKLLERWKNNVLITFG